MKHYNPSITERANRIFNLKNGDGISEEIAGPVAVIPISPVVRILKRSAGGTVYTTPTDKDFYLTGFYLSYLKTAADTGTALNFNVVVEGVTIQIHEEACVTLTADRNTINVELFCPIKLDRGSSITVSTTGTFSVQKCGIRGYTEEVTRT